MPIRPYAPPDLDAIVRLSLRAWEPVFVSLEQTLEPAVYQAFYPDGWRISQQQAVTAVCTGQECAVWVAEEEGSPVGFVAIKLHPDGPIGEIYMVAVDPDFQGQGCGGQLTDFALARIQEAGKSIAMVETGGDPGHAAARRTYEKSGFGLLPVARYFKKL
jgi:ribosomal protein S18 acetylase RimI-like enzyme